MGLPPPHPELQSILSILSATAHRNKNQHRLSKWWKPFSQLRRHVSSLISELELSHHEALRYGERHRRAVSSREAVERRVGFLIASLAPRCFLAFSALVADNQYAALGLMLLATLARVWKLILPLGGEVEEEDGDLERILGGLAGQEELDLGEVVRREVIEVSGKEEGEGEEERDGVEVKKPKSRKREGRETPPSKGFVVDSTPTKRPKKKRKKGDAFDDIFDSLI